MWAFGAAPSPSWTLLSPAGSPPIPSSDVPFYDSVDDQIVVIASDFSRFDVRALLMAEPPKGPTASPAVDEPAPARLASWELAAPRPDPMFGAASVDFTVPTAADITLAVFDVSGRQVATLERGWHEPGRYSASWNGRSETGALPSGVYMLRLATPAGTLSRSLVLLR